MTEMPAPTERARSSTTTWLTQSVNRHGRWYDFAIHRDEETARLYLINIREALPGTYRLIRRTITEEVVEDA